MRTDDRGSRFPLGSHVTMARLSADPYPTLAVETVTRILGLPLDQVPDIGAWYDRFADALANFARDPDVRARGHEASREFSALVQSAVESRNPNC